MEVKSKIKKVKLTVSLSETLVEFIKADGQPSLVVADIIKQHYIRKATKRL